MKSETGFSDSGFRFLPLMKRVISTGTRVMARMEEAAMAKVLVKARGRNIRPSWASSRNTGMKEMMMITSEKKMALPTCWPDVTIVAVLLLLLVASLGELPVGVLHHHDRRIHQHADGERDPSQGHDVGGDAQEVHGDEGDDDGNGQGENRHEGGAKMEKKDDDDEADDDHLFDQRFLQALDRKVDQLRSIVGGNDLDPLWEARLISLIFSFTRSMTSRAFSPKRITTIPPTTSPLPSSSTIPLRISDPGPPPQHPHEDGGPGLASDHDRLDVGDALDVAPSSHHVLPAAEFEQPPLHVIVGPLDLVHHLPDGDAVRGQALGVDVDLVLLHKPADAGHLRDPLHAGQCVADDTSPGASSDTQGHAARSHPPGRR